MIIAFKNSRNKWIAIDTVNNIGIIYKSNRSNKNESIRRNI